MQTSTIKQIRAHKKQTLAQIMQTKSQYYRLQICYVVSGYKGNHTSNGFRVKLICHHVLHQNTLETIHLKKADKIRKIDKQLPETVNHAKWKLILLTEVHKYWINNKFDAK